MPDPGFHEIAAIFPLMTGRPFDDLVEDIRQNGLREPVWLFEDQILDGRNRWRACRAADVEPVYSLYEGKDPIRFCCALNIHYRNLNVSQRAMAAARLIEMEELRSWIV